MVEERIRKRDAPGEELFPLCIFSVLSDTFVPYMSLQSQKKNLQELP